MERDQNQDQEQEQDQTTIPSTKRQRRDQGPPRRTRTAKRVPTGEHLDLI